MAPIDPSSASERVPPRSTLLEVARRAAIAGGRRTLEAFGRRIRPEIKPDRTPVTPSDRASEREIRRVIRRSFPRHAILGEEGGASGGPSRVRWVIDPIDGTVSFLHGVPLYSVLVAAEVDARPVVGVIHLPALGDTIAAALGSGCRWNGRPARVSAISRLSEATVLTSSVRALEARGVRFRRWGPRARTARTWGDAYGHALVATGRADAMLDTGLHPWDVAAIVPVVTEAGGRITDWSGRTGRPEGDFLSSNGRLHAELLRAVRP